MSTQPKVRQTRRAITYTDGSVRWEVTAEIFDRGDLPFTHLFVVTLTNSPDPKDDILARVATPFDIRQADPSAPLFVRVVETDITRIGADTFAHIGNVNDLTRLPRDRVIAQRQGFTQYLTSTISLIYTDVTTADAAARQINDRLSALTEEWRRVNSEFLTNPYQDYILPTTASSVEAERTAVYAAKKQARATAEATRDRVAEEKERCTLECAADKKIYDFLVYIVAFLDYARGVVNAITETIAPPGPTLLLTGGTTLTAPQTYTITANASTKAKEFVLQQGAYSADPASYEALRVKTQNDLNIYADLVRQCTDRCAQLSRDLLTAQQAVDQARTEEQAALASLLVVCPTFDPNTVTVTL